MVIGAPGNRQSVLRRQFVVRAHHDAESGGWWADSDDLPGLVTEAPTYDELVERVMAVVPELCRANNIAIADGDLVKVEGDTGTPCVTHKYPADPGKSDS